MQPAFVQRYITFLTFLYSSFVLLIHLGCMHINIWPNENADSYSESSIAQEISANSFICTKEIAFYIHIDVLSCADCYFKVKLIEESICLKVFKSRFWDSIVNYLKRIEIKIYPKDLLYKITDRAMRLQLEFHKETSVE